MAVKERTFPCGFHHPEVYWYDDTVAAPAGFYVPYAGSQVTDSIGHPLDRKTGKRVGGGPFFTSRVQASFQTVDVENAFNSAGKGSYASGPAYVPLPTSKERQRSGFTLEFEDDDLSHLDSLGATAIAQCSPGSPQAQLGTAVGETMKDGLPSPHGYRTWKSRALRVKNAGDEFLNHVYGWVPLVNDVTDTGRVISHLDNEFTRYHSESGSDTRRRFEFPSESSTTVLEQNPISWGEMPHFANPERQPYNGKWGVTTLSRTTERKRWFVGKFTYSSGPQTDSWRRVMSAGREAHDLLGLTLTPELLWELTPWSWAADWFSNIGDVMTNVTNIGQYGMVMRYGYMMEETITKLTKTLDHICIDGPRVPGTGIFHTNLALGPVSSSFEIISKRRAEANPFGFGIGWEGLSPLQLAITAALGITRLR